MSDEDSFPVPGLEVSSADLSEMTVASVAQEDGAPRAAVLRRRRSTPESTRPIELARLERLLVQLAQVGGRVEAVQWRDQQGTLHITDLERDQ